MPRFVIGTLQKPVDAQRLIDELVSNCHCDRENIGLLARTSTEHGSNPIEDMLRRGTEVATGAALAAGRVAGRAAQAAASVVAQFMPNLGVLSSVGPFAAGIANAGLKTTNELERALEEAGAARERAAYYADSVQRGGILVSVLAPTENMAKCVEETMRRHHALAPEASVAR